MAKVNEFGEKIKALDIKKQIKDKLISEWYFIPGNDLPMQAVVDVLKIDIDRLERIINYLSKVVK